MTNGLTSQVYEKRLFYGRAAIFSAAIFTLMGVYLPFFPIYLESVGFSSVEIGLAIAVPGFARVFAAPALTAAAAHFQVPARAAMVYAGCATLGFALVAAAQGAVAATIAAGAVGFVFWSSLVPIGDSVTIIGLRRHGGLYGRIRLWGSAAFIAANLVAGALVSGYGGGIVPIALIATGLFGVLAAVLLPRSQDRPVTGGLSSELQALRAVVQDRRLASIFLVGSLIQASHAVLYAFGSLFWSSQHFSQPTIGALWAVGVVAEILLFLVVGERGRWSPKTLLIAGGVLGLFRWIAFPIADSIAPAFALQLLHAATFAATHLAVMAAVAATRGPTPVLHLQAAYTLVAGFAAAGAAALAGPLYELAPTIAFGVMALLSGIAALVALLTRSDDPVGHRP